MFYFAFLKTMGFDVGRIPAGRPHIHKFVYLPLLMLLLFSAGLPAAKLEGMGAIADPSASLVLSDGRQLVADPPALRIFDTTAHVSGPVLPLPVRPGHSATLLDDGQVLILGGFDPQGRPSTAADLLDPIAGTSKALSAPGFQARAQHSATRLPDGTVWLFGGVGADGRPIAAPQRFNPHNAAWTGQPGTGLAPRAGHTATVLSDGQVLLAGGMGANGKPNLGAELWDPRTGAITVLPSCAGLDRVGGVARLLADGRVLMSGGRTVGGRTRDDAVLVDSTGLSARPLDADAAKSLGALEALRLAYSRPAAEDTRFSVGDPLVLRFSQPLRIDTVGPHGVALLGPEGNVEVRLTVLEGGSLVFIVPLRDLFPASRYTLFLDGLATVGGESLAFTSFGFTTESRNVGVSSGIMEREKPSSVPGASSMSNAASESGENPPQAANGVPGQSFAPRVLVAGGHLPRSKLAIREADDEAFLPGPQQRDGHWRTGRDLPEFVRRLADTPQVKAQRLRAGKAVDLLAQGSPQGLLDGLTLLPGDIAAATQAQGVGVTGVSGMVFRLNDKPLANVMVSIGEHSARTDREGRFTLAGIEPGHRELVVDGREVGRKDRHYGHFVIGVDVGAEGMTKLPYAVYLPRVRERDWIDIPSPIPADTLLTHPDLPGAELFLPKGTVLRDHAGKIVTRVAMVPVPLDRAPFPVDVNLLMYFSLQPGGMAVQGLSPASSQGIHVTYPNTTSHGPGKRVDFWTYDTAGQGWRTYGGGQISADGGKIVADAGVGLYDSLGGGASIAGGTPGANPAPPLGGCGPEPGDTEGDPVDCYTGLFLLYRTDLELADAMMPLKMSRTYRPGDSLSREFGMGSTHPFSLHLYKPVGTTSLAYLVLPDGAQVPYYSHSGGGFPYYYSGNPSRYSGSILDDITDNTYKHHYTIRLRDGTIYSFAGHDNNRLIAVADRFGNELKLTYTSGDLLSRIISPSGRYIDIAYDASNRIKSISDIAGRTVQYQYYPAGVGNNCTPGTTSPAGYLCKVIDPENHVEEYKYDAAGRMTDVIDARGNIQAHNDYDTTSGRVGHQRLANVKTGCGTGSGDVTLPLPAVCSEFWFAYTTDSTGKITQTDVTDSMGKVIRRKFNGNGLITDYIVAPGASQQAYQYLRENDYIYGNYIGQHVIVTDPLARKTRYSFDSDGVLVSSVTRMDGTSEKRIESYGYGPFSQLAQYTDGLNHVSKWRYGASGGLLEAEDALHNVAKFGVNKHGQLLSVTDPNGKKASLSYLVGDPYQFVDPNGRSTYVLTDLVGRTMAVIDAEGNRTLYQYDGLSQLVQTTDARNNNYFYSYDSNGNLTSLEDPKHNKTTYIYDAANRLIRRTDPLGHKETFFYDKSDRPQRVVDRKGQETTYTYDNQLDRLNKVRFNDGSTVDYSGYDLVNRPHTITDSVSGAITLDYDNFNRLKTETTALGQVSYQYDAADRLALRQIAGYPDQVYTYYDNDLIKTVVRGDQNYTFVFDPGSRLKTLTWASGLNVGYLYDNNGNPTSIKYSQGVGDLTYAYDTLGRRVRQGGSLLSVNLPSAQTAATFDANNRIATYPATPVTYDDNGNLTQFGGFTYVWDARGRLVEVDNNGTKVAGYDYDAFNRRIKRTLNGSVKQYLHDGLNPVQELDANGQVTAHLIQGPGLDHILSRIQGGTVRHFATDALGSTMALIDPTGAVKTSYKYDPFGTATVTGETGNPFQFTGRENDPGTGLMYYRARYYHPKTQRFISEDPIGFAGGDVNLYGYVGNNPVNLVDLLGLAPGDAEKQCQQTCAAEGKDVDLCFGVKIPFTQSASSICHCTKRLFKRWKPGDAIDKPKSDGTNPEWDLVRSRYWKSRYEASKNTNEFSKENSERMRRGLAPQDYNPKTGQWESRELHHVNPQRNNGGNNPFNLREVTPDQHRALDPYRR